MSDLFKSPTEKEIKKFLEEWGEKGRVVKGILERTLPEINELKTGIGWEIVKSDVERATALIEKSIKGEVTAEERAEVKYLYFTRIPRVVKLISTWINGLDAIASAQHK